MLNYGETNQTRVFSIEATDYIQRFLLIWAVSFAALIGVFSGLVQLLPSVTFSLTTSAAIILLSAIMGATYAFRANRSVHLPLEDLLPDQPTLGSLLLLECSVKRCMIAQVLDLAKRVYPTVAPPPIDRYEQLSSRKTLT